MSQYFCTYPGRCPSGLFICRRSYEEVEKKDKQRKNKESNQLNPNTKSNKKVQRQIRDGVENLQSAQSHGRCRMKTRKVLIL